MKRLLIVSGDRTLTQAVALGLSADSGAAAPATGDPTLPAGPDPSSAVRAGTSARGGARAPSTADEPTPAPPLARSALWEVARAHSGLEALVLLERGGRPFDALMVAPPLPDQNALALLNKIRRSEAGRTLPVYLLTERGKDAHLRRMAADSFGVTRFIDKPVSVETLRSHLDGLAEQLRVLLAEGDDDVRARYADCLTAAGYQVEALATGREAVERQPRLRPNAVVANLQLPDLPGLAMCAHIRRAAVTPSPKIILYGQLAALTAQSAQNTERADDFVQAPFDDELLVDRLGALIGRTKKRWRRRSPVPATEDLPRGATPARNRRAHRRIPCRIQVTVRSDQRRFHTESLDLSPGGLFLSIEAVLPVGTLVDLAIDIPDGDGTIRAVAKVAWISYSGDRRGLGVQFATIAPSALQRLEAYVALVGQVVYEP